MNTDERTIEGIRRFVGDEVMLLIKQIKETGEEMEALQAEKEYLDNYRKVKLDELQTEHRQKLEAGGKRITDKKCESLARSDSRYKIHLQKIKDARKAYGKKSAEHFELRNTFDALLEQMRNRRTKKHEAMQRDYKRG